MKNETSKAILSVIRRIEDNQASTDRDLEKDRQNLQDLAIKVSTLSEEVTQLRKAVNQNAERTRDKVAEAVEPVINSADNLATQIEKKKMVVLQDKRKWWQVILGIK